MSENFWDVKPPEDDERPIGQNEVETVEMPDIEQSNKIQFSNPFNIKVDGTVGIIGSLILI